MSSKNEEENKKGVGKMFKKRKFRRMNILVKPMIQIKFAIAVMVVFTLAVAVGWWGAFRSLTGVVINGELFSPTIRGVIGYIGWPVVAELVLMLIGVWLFSVLTMHLVMGPVYRFEKSLKAMQQGDFTQLIHGRKHDELKNVTLAFNKTVEILRTKTQDDQEKIEKLSQELKHLGKKLDSKKANKIDRIVEKLKMVRETFNS